MREEQRWETVGGPWVELSVIMLVPMEAEPAAGGRQGKVSPRVHCEG